MTNAAEGVLPLSIYAVLKGEHKEVSLFFAALEASPAPIEAAKRSLFGKLRKELLSHARAEEATVYDPLQAKISDTAMLDEARAEHEEMEDMLEPPPAPDVADDTWMEKLRELKEAVDHHVEEEESETFKTMEKLFSEDEAKALANAFHEAKKKEQEAIDS